MVCLTLAIQLAEAKPNSTDMQQRLDKLTKQLDEKRREFHVPGMALAIVKDNKLIFSKGFGVSDLAKETPVTNQTLFGLGSTTKAFTASLIGMLVDEGKIQWDDPVTKYLPYLQFKMDNKDDQITIRDMMSHQTGFTRFNLLYANGKVNRNEVLHAAIKAEPWAGFRESFHYTNLMVSAAGVAAAQSVDSSWEDLLEKRILKPLGMHNTTAIFNSAQQNPLMARGYMWLQEQGKHKKLIMHDITNIAPSAAINSNAEDMAKWLLLQLNDGKYNGKQLLSAEQIQESRKPQIKISGDAAYGLGWMLREYKGQKLVAHDGSVEGYSAIVALLPESNMGLVLLTNVTQTGLLGITMNMVWEALLNEQQTITAENTDNTSYAEYIGEYLANFATFKDSIFKFHLQDGRPYVDVPGQMNYELKPPNKGGKMYFAITDTTSISFDRNENGKISSMRMQQGGMNFEIPKKGVAIKAEINPEELQKYLGKYKSDLFKGDLTVKIQNQRLAVDVPGKMVFELRLADEKGHRHFRIKDSMSIVFETDENNKINALSVYREDKKLDRAKRIDASIGNKLPTIADILKLRQTKQHTKALLNSTGFRIKGTVLMKQSGVQGVITTSFSGYDHFREEVNFGQYGSVITTLNNKHAVIAPSFSDIMQQHGKYYEQTLKMHPASLIDWQHYYENIQVIAEDKFNNKKVYVLKFSGGKTPASTVAIDADNGDIVKIEANMLNPTLGSLVVTRIYENYKEIHGIRFPYKVTVKNDFNGESVIELESIESNVKFSPSIFKQSTLQLGE
jgi:CubicO group peptidase (beta-lactamase class C family)